MTPTEPIEATAREASLSPAELVPVSRGAIVSPAAKIEEVLEANRAYHELYSRLLDHTDFQAIRGKKFPKKSAWRKLSLAFNVDTEIVSREYERNEAGRIIRAEIVARAIAPNGRHADGLGACDLFEKCCLPTCRTNHDHCPGKQGTACDGSRHFSNSQHDLPATAETRAENRASSNLFGMGEVSAEEINAQRQAAEDAAPEPFDAVAHLNPFLSLLDKDELKHLSTWRATNELPAPRQMSQEQVERTLVQIGVLLGRRETSATAPEPQAVAPASARAVAEGTPQGPEPDDGSAPVPSAPAAQVAVEVPAEPAKPTTTRRASPLARQESPEGLAAAKAALHGEPAENDLMDAVEASLAHVKPAEDSVDRAKRVSEETAELFGKASA